MVYDGYTTEEVGRLGKQIYERDIRAKVEGEHRGKFLALDIRTGDYEIGEEDLMATERLRAKNPDATIFGVRIGYPAAYRIGGRFTRLIHDAVRIT